MAPPLPDRYRLQIRLGRDEDVEEWLAVDEVLDRPVLARVLGPESGEDRRRAFLESVRGAAAATHPHLTAVYAAAAVDDGAYMVGEWTGGVSLAHRLEARETMPVPEFLPNAAGLAGALADLHERGVVHGAIDPGAVLYTYAHPAKLGAYGRVPRHGDPKADVARLAEALEAAVTGSPPGLAPPSQVRDGLPRSVDEALEDARAGRLTAAELATRLRAVPSRAAQAPRPGWSWRWLAPASVLLGLAVAIASLGLVLKAPPDSPILFPASPGETVRSPTTAPQDPTTSAPPPEAPEVRVVEALAYDPFGDGHEHDDRVPAVLDGDPDTDWTTERYFSPIRLQKEGVGLVFAVEGTPSQLEFTATPETSYTIWWAEAVPEDFDEWNRIASGTTAGGATRRQLASRRDGVWLLWFEDLPAQDDGYLTRVTEVRFLP